MALVFSPSVGVRAVARTLNRPRISFVLKRKSVISLPQWGFVQWLSLGRCPLISFVLENGKIKSIFLVRLTLSLPPHQPPTASTFPPRGSLGLQVKPLFSRQMLF